MIFVELYKRFIEITLAPIHYTEMIWILTPLIISLLLMEFYSKYHKNEDLSWNTSFGNSLVLIFVSLDLLRNLYSRNMLEYVNLENALAIGVVLLGFTLTILTFFHLLPKKIAFDLSSRLPVNIIAYLAVVIIYAEVTIDFYTAVASLLFVLFAMMILKIVDWFVPESGEIPELEDIEEDTEET